MHLLSAPSPREAVYIPSETSPRQEKKPPRSDQPMQDGVDARQYRDALIKECSEAEFRWVIQSQTDKNWAQRIKLYNKSDSTYLCMWVCETNLVFISLKE